MRLRDSLPPLLEKLVERKEWDEALTEKRADCGNCNQARGPLAIYKDHLKCCTFYPFVPNFLLGAILSNDTPAKAAIESAIAGANDRFTEANFLPLGLMPSVIYQKRFHDKQPDGYGNDESLLCPHFIKATGGCGIWKFRPSPCRSFFCESSYGLPGIEFWAKYEKLVSHMELQLAIEALQTLGFTEDEAALSLRFMPNYVTVDTKAFRGEKLKAEIERSWVEFGSDRADFYRKCFETLQKLEPQAAKELMKGEAEALESDLFSTLWPRVQAYAKA